MRALAKQGVIGEERATAMEQPEVAIPEKPLAPQPLRTRRERRKAALVAMKAAARHDKSLRWRVFALTLRVLSPLQIGFCVLIAGSVLAIAAQSQGWWSPSIPSNSAPSLHEDESGVGPKLKLELNLAAH